MTRAFTSKSSIVARPDGLFELLVENTVITKPGGGGFTYEEAEQGLDFIEQHCWEVFAALKEGAE